MASESRTGVAVVVGVGEGLGVALAHRFAESYKVALIARSGDVIENAAAEIKAAGGIALPIQSDAPAPRTSPLRMTASPASLVRSAC